jgi:hypothetical protein
LGRVACSLPKRHASLCQNFTLPTGSATLPTRHFQTVTVQKLHSAKTSLCSRGAPLCQQANLPKLYSAHGERHSANTLLCGQSEVLAEWRVGSGDPRGQSEVLAEQRVGRVAIPVGRVKFWQSDVLAEWRSPWAE